MTEASTVSTGAPQTSELTWNSINWKHVKAQVRRLQMRIAKAYRDKKYNKVKSLQWLLTHSFYAKLLAVKRVTENRGAKTPGVDNVTWRTPKQKMKAVLSLKRRGYTHLCPTKKIVFFYQCVSRISNRFGALRIFHLCGQPTSKFFRCLQGGS